MALILVISTWVTLSDPTAARSLGDEANTPLAWRPVIPWVNLLLAGVILLGAVFAARRERFWLVLIAALAINVAGLVPGWLGGGPTAIAMRLFLLALVVGGHRFYKAE
jgi:hypothetical protein